MKKGTITRKQVGRCIPSIANINKLNEEFKRDFPEFSLQIITWFRKRKHLL